MGLFKEGSGSPAGSFVKEDEKAVLLFSKVAFPIIRVTKNTEGQYGPQYNVETILPGSDEARIISFKANSVPNRAAGLETIIEMQDAGTWAPVLVRLEKDGRAIVLVEVEDETVNA